MSPEETIKDLNKHKEAGGFSWFDIVRESGYQGARGAMQGKVTPSANNLYKLQQAMSRLEQGRE